ncbi:hypothetical protein C8J56DRAFT_1064691 [Mycena floridula]|nr:hypothetical protein C8J56DRAFT_1064691 [Mycena floridula]
MSTIFHFSDDSSLSSPPSSISFLDPDVLHRLNPKARAARNRVKAALHSKLLLQIVECQALYGHLDKFALLQDCPDLGAISLLLAEAQQWVCAMAAHPILTHATGEAQVLINELLANEAAEHARLVAATEAESELTYPNAEVAPAEPDSVPPLLPVTPPSSPLPKSESLVNPPLTDTATHLVVDTARLAVPVPFSPVTGHLSDFLVDAFRSISLPAVIGQNHRLIGPDVTMSSPIGSPVPHNHQLNHIPSPFGDALPPLRLNPEVAPFVPTSLPPLCEVFPTQPIGISPDCPNCHLPGGHGHAFRGCPVILNLCLHQFATRGRPVCEQHNDFQRFVPRQGPPRNPVSHQPATISVFDFESGYRVTRPVPTRLPTPFYFGPDTPVGRTRGCAAPAPFTVQQAHAALHSTHLHGESSVMSTIAHVPSEAFNKAEVQEQQDDWRIRASFDMMSRAFDDWRNCCCQTPNSLPASWTKIDGRCDDILERGFPAVVTSTEDTRLRYLYCYASLEMLHAPYTQHFIGLFDQLRLRIHAPHLPFFMNAPDYDPLGSHPINSFNIGM